MSQEILFKTMIRLVDCIEPIDVMLVFRPTGNEERPFDLHDFITDIFSIEEAEFLLEPLVDAVGNFLHELPHPMIPAQWPTYFKDREWRFANSHHLCVPCVIDDEVVAGFVLIRDDSPFFAHEASQAAAIARQCADELGKALRIHYRMGL